MGIELNQFLIIYCYTHRLLYVSLLIKEVSYWSRKTTQRPSTGQGTEKSRLWTAQS